MKKKTSLTKSGIFVFSASLALLSPFALSSVHADEATPAEASQVNTEVTEPAESPAVLPGNQNAETTTSPEATEPATVNEPINAPGGPASQAEVAESPANQEKLKETYGGDKTEWTGTQLKNFFKGAEKTTTYIRANTAKDGSKTSLVANQEPLTEEELDNLSPQQYDGLYDKTVGSVTVDYPSKVTPYNVYELKPGLTWTYKNVTTDVVSGRNIDLEYSVTDVQRYFPEEDYPGNYVQVRTDDIGTIITMVYRSVTYQVKMKYSDTGEEAKINAIVGFADLDHSEELTFSAPSFDWLVGSNLNYNVQGNGVYAAGKQLNFNAKPTDTGNQVWFLVRDGSTFSYTFGSYGRAEKERNGRTSGGDYLGIGEIDFSVNLAAANFLTEEEATATIQPMELKYQADPVVTPVQAKPVENIQVKATLPSTGTSNSSWLTALGLALIAGLTSLPFMKKKAGER